MTNIFTFSFLFEQINVPVKREAVLNCKKLVTGSRCWCFLLISSLLSFFVVLGGKYQLVISCQWTHRCQYFASSYEDNYNMYLHELDMKTFFFHRGLYFSQIIWNTCKKAKTKAVNDLYIYLYIYLYNTPFLLGRLTDQEKHKHGKTDLLYYFVHCLHLATELTALSGANSASCAGP